MKNIVAFALLPGSLATIALCATFAVDATVPPATQPATTIVASPSPISVACDEPGPVITFSLPRPVVQQWEEKRFLEAIAQVESGGKTPHRPGPAGELGLYQFRSHVWKQYTRTPFRHARNPEVSTVVARRHCNWLRQQLMRAGYRGTPYEVALAWNAGIGNVLAGRIADGSFDYANRVSNLVTGL